ncbi:unnamed protein product, partial [Adineta steineri]
PASFAQTRIWLDERIRFDPDKPQIAIYNMPFVYCLQPGNTLSIKQLRHALHLTVNKHPSLHTSLHFDIEKNLLMQRVLTHEDKNNNIFSIIETTYETDKQLNEILHDEKRNPHLFDLAHGLVFRCHIIYHKQISSDHLLSHKDLLIFNFHHALFDFPSMNIFLHDLNQAYTTGQLLYVDNTLLRYIDYSVIEQQMSMTGASMFWLDALHDCKLYQPLSLPFDRYRLANEHRTGRGTSISFELGQDLSHDFLTHASSNNISLEHLTFAVYFIFLFKLTNGQTDLCLTMNINNNRYRDELKSIIGLFENVIPLRCQLDPHWYFYQLLQHVEEITTKSMKYSYFPLQRILDQHPHISKYAFLDTSLEFISHKNSNDNNTVMIGDSQLVSASSSFNISEDEILSVSDFSLSINHDLNINQLSCTVNASFDLFNRETVEKISQRFHSIIQQLSASIIDNQINKSIYEISLTLPNEQYLMQSLNNTQVSFPSTSTCIHHEFVYQVMKHPQKLAVELDEQSLTYCELLYYVQVLSLTLLNEYHVVPGEIVCQCVERSLSMVIGIMAIEMAGGVYCPLSPRDPQYRLHALTQQTKSRVVLAHDLTKTKFDDDIVSPNIDSLLNINNMDSGVNYNCLSSVEVKDKELAYIIFTSGSTGTPKAVQVRHKNFIDCINSLAFINSFNKDDTVVQMTRCSFDIHVQEILGEPFSVPLIGLIVKIGITNCIVWNLYGPAEATIGSTIHYVDVKNDTQSIPIGRPFYNYRFMILNEYLQSPVVSQEGELFVGGAGVFAGYLSRDDLTAKALVEIDGDLFYRTGDLVKMDSDSLLYYIGRNDNQVKLRGQRIELGEIERCLLSKSISACVVIKGSNDHLVAYVQSSDADEKQLRQYYIQQAYLVGREGLFELGHVSAFVYKEYDFPSTFNIECFERALNYLIQRHEALRLIFPSHTEQKILKTVPYYTISILNLDDVQSSQKHLIERREQLSHQIRPADQWPLFDFQITRFITDDGYKIRLHYGIDALLVDFWSANLVLHELNQLYCNLNVILVELKLSYRDYILAEQQWKHTTIYSNDRQYWINRLKSFPLGPNLPLQCLPNEIHAQRHCNAATVFDRVLWQELRKRITDHGLTPAGFLASIYALVLGKWSENKHFALNLPVFNRLPIHPHVNQIVGDFTTVIPLEINLDKISTYDEFLQDVQKQLWNDLEHMSYDGVSFVRDLMQEHQTRGILLPYVFTCGVDVENNREESVEHNLFFDQVPVYAISQTPQVFIDHVVLEIDDCLSINWTYVENLLRKEMLSHMHDTFVGLLVKLASFDDIWQKPIFVSLPSEQQQRRLDFNQTQWESNVQDKLLHSLVIKQAELTPHAFAILSSQVNLTYEQLMKRAYSLAYHLQQQHKINSNQLIAILMKKGWEQIVACLAILVSGGAYLPLDVDSPYDRLCSLIEETNVTILLTQSHCQHTFPHLTTIPVDTFTTNANYLTPFPIKQQSSTDIAYIIYTSGSTGKPKGVMISHQAVVNTILDMNSRLEISTNDRIFALSHLNFDLSVYDIFGILIAGGAIVIPNHEDYKNPQHWYDMISQHHVTVWNSVPMLMQMFVEHLKQTNNINQLRHILLSGDWIPLSLPKSIQTTFGEQVTITSLGGATEASIWSVAYTLPKEIPQEWKSIPYGMPLRNQQYYVYDIHLDDCPEWVTGELYIGGEGLANGYWNDEEKTQSSFIIHPLTNKRLYRTGDYGRFLPNGYVEFTGRKDFQVKVHGHRIELGEIEHHLQQHPDIHQAIVNNDDKSQQLIGYIMPEKYSIQNEEYDSTEMLITDPIERINFKLTRHSIRHEKKVEKSFALTKPKLTETLINTYYMRKSYRQFTNETIERSTIEKLLKNGHNSNSNEKISLSHLDSDILSQLLVVLTPISISGQPLPKYRYASAGNLYPVQVYVELTTSIDNISPGVYYHNPDEHTLELISTHINDEMMNIRLHLVGRSSAITPLYGKRLGSQFCMLETGYVMRLLEKEGSRLGLTFSTNIHNESITRDILNIDENDTHCCFKVSSFEQNMSSDVQNDNHQCIIYLKSVNNNKDQWFIYNKKNDTAIPFDVETKTKQEEIPLFFDDDDDAKIIFHDCQGAIFFVGRSENTINIGKMSHLLMDHCLEMNIGMCPIGTRTSFPKQINDVLDTILIHEKLNGSNILHTLLIGKISNQQKYERTMSTVQSMPNWSEILRIYLREKLPMYMVPSHFMSVSSFPLSPNGKIDRKALSISNTFLDSLDMIHQQHVEPRNELETYIHSLWCQILSRTRISINTNFFDIGGHSLLLVQLYQNYKMTLNIDRTKITISELFHHTTIADHARLIQQPIDDPEIYQKRLLAVHDMQETSIQKHIRSIFQENIILVTDDVSKYELFRVTDLQAAYLVGREGALELGNISAFVYTEYDFSTTFDIKCFERALNSLIQRHEALRLIFPSHTEQQILKAVPYYTISILNLDDVQSIQEHLIERREQLSQQIRPANEWPLFDFQITRFITDDGYNIRLHFGIDMLIVDFWSTNLVLHELNQLYCNLNDNLVELKLSYRDYVLAQQEWEHTNIYNNDRQYWINRLKSFPLGPNLPLQCLPNEIHVQRHCNATTLLDRSLWQKLRKRIIYHGLTPAGFLASVYALVLGKWSENKHFALNLPVFNRLPIHPHVNQIVGDFTTVIPLEINLDKVITYYEFLHTVQKQLWNDLEHISYDGVSFIRELMQVHQTRKILLPYVFTCGVDVEDIRAKNVEHNILFDQGPVYQIGQTPQVFLDHIVVEIDGCLSTNWMYVENLFRKEMLNHMHDTFVGLLVKLASFDDIWQKPIFIPLPSEQQERRLDFNQTQWESNVKEKLLHSLVIKQAKLIPNALAIISSQVNLTYRQLMSRVYSLAHHLQQQETYSNQFVAILMKKGWEQIVACLAILVSGGAYLPLDIDSPYDRLCSLIEETNVTILLTQSHCQHAFPHLTTIPVDTFAIDDNYPTSFHIKQQSSTDIAYVIYTSGSTGKPKGVMISHQAVVNTILDMNSRLEISTNDRIFALSHLNFDLSVYDIFGTLIGGGTIVIPNHEDYKNPEHWYDMIIQHHVTVWNSVPVLMQMFVEHLKQTNNINQLRHILLSGDWIPLSLPESIRVTLGEQVTITSLGGATEASIWSIAFTLPRDIPQEWKSIPYGIPLRNQQYYVYDIHLDDCPEWVVGELYIGGEGLANGYWNDQEKTQSSFIIHPLTNKRLYRTGDYGRFLPTGYIEFTGRKDFQVKVHGHRIELGEIEH